jgi:molybdopterin-dependent oxidoreductase alpha subunit
LKRALYIIEVLIISERIAMAEIKKNQSWMKRLARLVPFGLGQVKPKHFRDMARVIWENRDNLPYAWKVLTRGVCDGCALGVAGLHDWTIDGIHLCMTRLNLLRLNTMPGLDIDRLRDVGQLTRLRNDQLRRLGRLPFPLLRQKGDKGFKRISWDEALERIGRRLRAASPDRMAFFVTSRGVTNETYYAAQKAARFLGTNNVDNSARLCHSPSTAAMKSAIGYAATTCSYKDFYQADLIVFFGANPANDQPVTMKYLHEAKSRGAKVALVNPYLEPGMERYWVPSTVSSALFGTDVVDAWFPVSQGGDIAFLYGTLKVLLEKGWVNWEFQKAHTTGFEALAQKAAQTSWESLEKQSGLPESAMREFAGLIHRSPKAILVWSMGITQHVFGADAVSMIVNLGLSQGYVGREGCGLMPIRGHSSVQAGAEMGAYSTAFPGGKPITNENAKELSGFYGFPVPDKPGLSTVDMVEAASRGELDVLYCMGGNFLRTLPEPEYVRQALAKVPLRVHQDIILTDQMLVEGEEVILLPAQTRYEQEGGGTETSTERRVMFSPEIERQVGEARPEWKILLQVAAAVYPEKAKLLGCGSAQEIREEVARIVPLYAGVEKLSKTGDAFQYGGAHLCVDGKFATADGKAHFKAVTLPDTTRKEGEFELSTRRGKQFNSIVYAEVDPLNNAPRDAVLMNGEDAGKLHLKQGDLVELVSGCGRMSCRVQVAPMASGNLQVHWPEGNILIPRGLVDAGGGVPDYNARVRIEVPSAQRF